MKTFSTSKFPAILAWRAQLKGIPTNLELCAAIAASEKFAKGDTTTAFLNDFPFSPHAVEVVAPGMNTTVQVQVLAFRSVLCLPTAIAFQLLGCIQKEAGLIATLACSRVQPCLVLISGLLPPCHHSRETVALSLFAVSYARSWNLKGRQHFLTAMTKDANFTS